MIHLFRAGLPPEIYRLMVREYFELHRILERLVEGQLLAADEGKRREGESQVNYRQKLAPLRRDPQMTELLLALSVFYRHVIAQFEGAGRVMKRMSTYQIPEVRLGSSTLDVDAARQMDIAVRQFYSLLREFEIPTEILREHDIKEFASTLATYVRTRE